MARRRLASAVLLDVLGLLLALEVASLTVFSHPLPWVARTQAWPMLWSIAFGAAAGLFLAFRPGAASVRRPSYGRALTMSTVMLAVTSVTLVFSRVFWSRRYVLVTTLAWLGIGLVQRFLRRMRPWTEPLVVITDEKLLVEDLLASPHADVVAVLPASGRPPVDLVRPGTTIAVDLRSVLSDEMARFVSSCNLAGYPMRSLVSAYEDHTGKLPIVHIQEGWEITVPLEDRSSYVRVKRVLDTALTVVVSPVALVLGVLIAAAIAIDSRGPVVFRQSRVGRNGRAFTLYKFRTMRSEPDREARFAALDDGRLTRVGRLLRRLRLDELPQLWNVLKGDLSLVGPRPEQGAFAQVFASTIPFYSQRHLVRPGITGWAQVNFGYADSEADTVEKLSYDLYYVKHLSLWLDLEILGRSIWTVLSASGR